MPERRFDGTGPGRPLQPRWHAILFGDRMDPRARLAALYGGPVPAGGQPPAAALDWARGVLAEEPARGELEAVRVLRRRDARLTLRSARFLAQHALASR